MLLKACDALTEIKLLLLSLRIELLKLTETAKRWITLWTAKLRQTRLELRELIERHDRRLLT